MRLVEHARCPSCRPADSLKVSAAGAFPANENNPLACFPGFFCGRYEEKKGRHRKTGRCSVDSFQVISLMPSYPNTIQIT